MIPKRAFISISFQNRQTFDPQIRQIVAVLGEFDIEALVFVLHYDFEASQERKMMALALAEIQRSDLMIAEVSDKAIGIGIEIGYAAALGKPILYLRSADSEHSTTVGGVATEALVYTTLDDLRDQLRGVLARLVAL